MARTCRYSYWALAAGLAVTIGLADVAAFAFLSLQSGKTPTGVANDFVLGLICIATCGPVCLILGKSALRDIQRNPALLGEGIAEIAVELGRFVTAAIVLVVAFTVVSLVAVSFSGGFSGWNQ